MKKIRFGTGKTGSVGIFAVRILNCCTVLKRTLFLSLIIAGCASQQKSTTVHAPSAANLRSHVTYLASDSLEGRRTGSVGETLAAVYIASHFQKAGLQPKGTDGFFQPFPVSTEKVISPATALTINDTPLALHKDFFPLPFSANGTIDAMASISLLERGEPWFVNLAEMLNQNKNNPHFDVGTAVQEKAAEVAAKGGTALFVYNNTKIADGLSFDGKTTTTATLPVVYLTSKTADIYLKDPAALLRIKATVAIDSVNHSGKNVVGYLDNGAPTTVVIGAHYDHLGYGEDHGTSLYRGTDKQIHNGADDNASGTAALLELARLLRASPLKKNNYLFIAFSGEEQGLFGSKYFTQHPTIDLSTVNFMVNMDMVGRLNDSTQTLTVGGYGTSPVWGQLYGRQGTEALYPVGNYRFDSSGTGPSDHTSFYLKDIPVLFYFTGLHTDYHRPTDDADKLNYTGQARIVQHLYSLLQAASSLPGKVTFTKTRETPVGTTARFSVTLGILPDYTYGGKGVRVDGVSEGRPAQKAGLQTGDVITALGPHTVNSVESYMQALSNFKKGDSTTVQYNRNGKTQTVRVSF